MELCPSVVEGVSEQGKLRCLVHLVWKLLWLSSPLMAQAVVEAMVTETSLAVGALVMNEPNKPIMTTAKSAA